MRKAKKKDSFKQLLFEDEIILNEDEDVAIFTDRSRFYVIKKSSRLVHPLAIVGTQIAGKHKTDDLLDFGKDNHSIFLFLYKKNLYYGKRIPEVNLA